ncbi:MAG: aminopeptidase N [Leptospira sp.]|nr:aminopeptidase N [Leptospira sp.]
MHSEPSRKKIRLVDYKPPSYKTDSLSLEFHLDSKHTIVSSDFVVYPSHEQDELQDYRYLFLNGINLQLLNIKLDGNELSESDYQLTSKGLEILKKINKPTRLQIVNSIRPIENSELLGLYQSSGIFCTQNEPEGFRRITYFFDRPDVLCTYKVKIVTDAKIPYLLANGNLLEQGLAGDGKHYAIWEDPFPKPTYLFALVAGDLEKITDNYTTKSGKVKKLEIYTNIGKSHYANFAMESLKLAMEWDEDVFHREYDLDTYMIVAVDDFNMGAMENKGLNVFNSKLVLASPDTATDSIFEDILSVIAHEYFHNWTGNRITLRDWFQLTLKEGLTVFRDQLFSQDKIGAGVKRIDDVDFLRNYQFPEDAGKLSHPIQPKEFLDIDNFYTRTVYEKGAEVIRMIYTIVGREKFVQALDHYFEDFDGKAITTEEFVSVFEKNLGVDLVTFRNWYHRKGTPVLEINDTFDPKAGTYTIEWKDCNHSESALDLHYPVLYTIHKNGNSNPSNKSFESGLFHWKGKGGREQFTGLVERPVLSLLQNFSAPIHLRWSRPKEDLYYLWVHDSDPFTRWDSGLNIKIQEIERLSLDSNAHVDRNIIQSYRELLINLPGSWEGLRLLSYLLQIPGLTSVTNLQDVYKIDESFRSIQKLESSITAEWKSVLISIYLNYSERLKSNSFDRLEASSLRLFKNTILGFLFEEDEMLYKQFSESESLTEKIAALKILSHSDSPLRLQALDEFAYNWKSNPLVMDYWLSIQASSCREDTLETVRNLKKSDYFDIRNPNRVSALLGSFSRNRLRFHREDGVGYEFLVEAITELDGINSQSSSRLAKQFTDFAKLPARNQEKLRIALKPLKDSKSLSDLLYEVVQSI